MDPWNYRRDKLVKRATTTKGEDVRVEACLVVGLVVEAALILCYRRDDGVLPKALERQAAVDHPSVLVSKVVAPDKERASSALVKVFPNDADLGIKIARTVVEKLFKCFLKLVVITAVHTNKENPAQPNHDIIAQPAFDSSAQKGFYSVEIRCREIQSRKPKEFNWMQALEDGDKKQDTRDNGARGVWEQELNWDATPWAARILVLVELPRPCHSGNTVYTHASILWKGRSAWENLWGWNGFWPRHAFTVTTNNGSNKTPAVSASCPTLKLASSTAQKDADCKRLLAKLAARGVDVTNDNSWVRLSLFLTIVDKPTNHAGRFVDPSLDSGKNKKCWKSESGGVPKVKKEWTKVPGPRGGGAGDGLHHISLRFLKFVYRQYHYRLK